MSIEVGEKFNDTHKRVRTKIYFDRENGKDVFTRKNKFCIEVFNILLDKLGAEYGKKYYAYKNLG